MYGNNDRYGNSPTPNSVAKLTDEELSIFTEDVSTIMGKINDLLPNSYMIDSMVTEEGPMNQQAVIIAQTMVGASCNIVVPVTMDRLETFNETGSTFFEDGEPNEIAADVVAQVINVDKESGFEFPQVAQ